MSLKQILSGKSGDDWITRVSKESVFSDLNNLEGDYAIRAVFRLHTEEEVFSALDAFGMSEKNR